MISTGLFSFLLTLLLFGQQTPFLTKSARHFNLKCDRNLREADIASIAEKLDQQYADCQKRYNLPARGKISAMILNSSERYKTYSKARAYDDASVREGVVYICAPVLKDGGDDSEHVLRRVVSRAMLNDRSGIPPWLAEAFSLYAGNELNRFGDPARLEIGSFEDLSEEFSRAQSPRDIREAHAKLSVTIEFFVRRFGEKKIAALLSQFKPGYRFDDIAGQWLGEPIHDIEQAWLKVIRSGKRD